MSSPTRDGFVLAVDLGTGGPKVGLVSFAGELAWHEHVAVSTTWLSGGGAVQDAEVWWQSVTEAARRGLGSGAVEPARVRAVCCTGQFASTVPVDAAGNPVGDALLWMDSRGSSHSREVIGGPLSGYSPVSLARWVRRSGGAPSPSGADPVGHILFLELDLPEVARRARWYLEPVDYLSMRFSGVASATHASMLAAWLTDNRRLGTFAYDQVLVRNARVPQSKLAPLRRTGSVVGSVKDDVARALGLDTDVPVVTGIPDLHSAVVGSGALGEFETHLALSTSSWISCPVPFKRTDAIRQIASVPGLGDGRYLVADNHETGGACLQWLKDGVLSQPGTSGPSFEDLLSLAAGADTGSGGVIFTPWLSGERSPVDDRCARAGFHNLTLRSTRADLVRAVLEGVAYNSRWLHRCVERFTRRRLDDVRIVGGGASSELWCQIHADVLGRRVLQVADPVRANLRGAAMFAGLSLGALHARDVDKLVEVSAVFTPQSEPARLYDEVFEEFPRLYKAQRKMFRRLNQPITAARKDQPDLPDRAETQVPKLWM